MPIYEYQCQDCKRRTSFFIKGTTILPDLSCPSCGSARLSRLLSRFAVLQPEERRMEHLTDPRTYGDLDETDPSSVKRWIKQVGKTVGDAELNQLMGEALEEAVGEKGEDETEG